MGYHHVDPADVEPLADRPAATRDVTTETGLETLGLRRYVVAPGGDIPSTGHHYHDRQGEAFYVVSGDLGVETLDREYAVGTGEFLVVEAWSPHRAFEHPESRSMTVVVAMGAPSVNDGTPMSAEGRTRPGSRPLDLDGTTRSLRLGVIYPPEAPPSASQLSAASISVSGGEHAKSRQA